MIAPLVVLVVQLASQTRFALRLFGVLTLTMPLPILEIVIVIFGVGSSGVGGVTSARILPTSLLLSGVTLS